MQFKCVIVDDEPIAHDVLQQHLSKTNLECINSFFNAHEAKVFLENNRVDILFLDIKMPGISGLNFLKLLTDKPVTIITTAYREYALEGFELGVIDYLLKPVSFFRFKQSVDRATEFLILKGKANKLPAGNVADKTDSFVIKSGTKIISLKLGSISHVQGLKDYTIFYADQKKYVVRGYIKTIVAMLPAEKFTRVHKSFIVANNRIKYVKRNQIEFDQYQVPIGRLYKNTVKEIIGL